MTDTWSHWRMVHIDEYQRKDGFIVRRIEPKIRSPSPWRKEWYILRPNGIFVHGKDFRARTFQNARFAALKTDQLFPLDSAAGDTAAQGHIEKDPNPVL